MPLCTGLVTAVLTPFDSGGRIDFDYIARHLEFLCNRGVNGVVVSGTNGESPSMSFSERKELLRFAVENKQGLHVIAGTGCPSLPETIELTRAAQAAGADAALVVPPFFFKDVSVDGLARYYAGLLAAVDLPVILYNIPSCSGVPIIDKLVQRLLGISGFAGIKDTSGDPQRTESFCASFPELVVYNGTDSLINATINSGVKGTISGIANAFPELISNTIKECAAGGGAELQERVNALGDIYFHYPLFATNKYALHLQGFPLSHVRPPLVDLSPDQMRSFEAALRQQELI